MTVPCNLFSLLGMLPHPSLRLFDIVCIKLHSPPSGTVTRKTRLPQNPDALLFITCCDLQLWPLELPVASDIQQSHQMMHACYEFSPEMTPTLPALTSPCKCCPFLATVDEPEILLSPRYYSVIDWKTVGRTVPMTVL